MIDDNDFLGMLGLPCGVCIYPVAKVDIHLQHRSLLSEIPNSNIQTLATISQLNSLRIHPSPNTPLPLPQDHSRMINIHHNHSNKHQKRIKPIPKSLMRHNKPIIPTLILNKPENRADQNKCTNNIQRQQDSNPVSLSPALAACNVAFG